MNNEYSNEVVFETFSPKYNENKQEKIDFQNHYSNWILKVTFGAKHGNQVHNVPKCKFTRNLAIEIPSRRQQKIAFHSTI